MPFIVATYVYASSQGQRTHSARTNNIINDRKLGKGVTYSKILLLVDSNKHIHKIFYIFLYFWSEYANNPRG
jgi:hypothetical protein